MPELPEVETIVRDLRPLLIERHFTHLTLSDQALRQPWQPEWSAQVLGGAIQSIRRRGKWMILNLASGRRLVVHLGMTGQLTVTSSALPLEDHTHLVFTLDGGLEQLRYRDIRRFGGITLYADEATTEAFLNDTLGPEPFDLNPATFQHGVQATARCLKAVLLDQHIVAGVGNIYADESLHTACLHPSQLGRATTSAECVRLQSAIVEVLTRAIERRGSSIRNYVGGSGLRGGYQEEFRAYGRTGQPCPRCDTAIEVVRLAGRSSHYCPRCQRTAS